MLVALLAEGVDRNIHFKVSVSRSLKSPSSRRAWIEMYVILVLCISLKEVALLAEGVDRNQCCHSSRFGTKKSPSSRRAWIEIEPLVVD